MGFKDIKIAGENLIELIDQEFGDQIEIHAHVWFSGKGSSFFIERERAEMFMNKLNFAGVEFEIEDKTYSDKKELRFNIGSVDYSITYNADYEDRKKELLSKKEQIEKELAELEGEKHEKIRVSMP